MMICGSVDEAFSLFLEKNCVELAILDIDNPSYNGKYFIKYRG